MYGAEAIGPLASLEAILLRACMGHAIKLVFTAATFRAPSLPGANMVFTEPAVATTFHTPRLSTGVPHAEDAPFDRTLGTASSSSTGMAFAE